MGLAVSLADSRYVFAGTDDGVFLSGDRGENWSPTGLTRKTWYLAVDSEKRTVYAGTDGEGVFVSRDTGATWVSMNEGLGDLVVQTVAMDPVGCDKVYAGTNDGIWERPEQ